MVSKPYTDDSAAAQRPRKSLSKKARFEVLKRDGFACQYCGAKAPDALLHVDHIEPVSKGGSNDILNLITACQKCNSGKSDRELSDDTPLQAQLEQARTLSARREQLEMMAKWVSELSSVQSDELDFIVELANDKTRPLGYSMNEHGVKIFEKAYKKYGLKPVIEAIEASAKQYLDLDTDDAERDCIKFYKAIEGICYWNDRGGMPDDVKRVFYIRGILRRRLHYVNDKVAYLIIRDASASGVDMDWLEDLAKSVRNWSDFRILCEQETMKANAS